MNIAPEFVDIAKAKLLGSCIPEPNSGCWLWLGSLDDKGYGRMSAGKLTRGAHRFSWALLRGPIPAGMFVCHKCDVPACVNPDHLFLGTNQDNMTDKVNKFRHNFCDRNPRAKITAEIAKLIRESKEKSRFLAKRYGLSTSQIRRIRRNNNWTLLNRVEQL